MSTEEKLEMRFERPSDYSLHEFSELLTSLRDIYDKLELIAEGNEPFGIYDGKRRWNGGRLPDVPLVLMRIRYGQSLHLSLRGSPQIRDLSTVLEVVSYAQELIKRTGQSPGAIHSRKGIKEALRLGRPETRNRSNRMVYKYDLSLKRIFDYLGPEMDDLLLNRARFK